MAQEILKITDPKIAEQFHMYLPKNMTSNTNEKGQITYDPNSYIITSSKNIVSKRKAAIYGSANIILRGFSIVEHSCVIRGDLANIQCDVHVVLMPGVLLRPPIKQYTKGIAFFPISIGSYTMIGSNSIIQALNVGSCRYIGENVILGKRTNIRDCVIIEDNCVIPDDTHIPPYSVVKAPCQITHQELNFNFKGIMERVAKLYYQNFVPEIPK